MKHNKAKFTAAALAALMTISATACSSSSSGQSADTTADKTAASASTAASGSTISAEAFEISAADKDVGYEESDAVSIDLDGSTAEINGNGAECSDGVLSITEAGTYILSGSFNGQIRINSKGSEIKLVLGGVKVANGSHSALLVEKASKVTLTLEAGTVNSFSDGAEYEAIDADDNADAAIFSRADLTINGDGELDVTGNYKHAIVSKDELIITGGTINTESVSGGICGKDSVKISGGDMSVTAGSNGIRATNDEDDTKGLISITGGTINITAAGDGIQAETVLKIDGGDISVTTGGGSENASVRSDGSPNGDWGNWDRGDMGGGFGGDMGGMQPPEGDMQPGGDMTTNVSASGGLYLEETAFTVEQTSAETTDTDSTSTSAKALKAGVSIEINGGAINIDSSDDSLHSNGSITVTDGVITAKSGDDGAHADDTLTISGGTVDIQKSYEGIEGLNIYVSGGDISVIASDDGFNAAGGSDTGMADRMGRDDFNTSASGSYVLDISGGSIVVNANGDGLDSNGDLYISGGTIYVSGPTNGGNGALDYGDLGSTAQITGGTIIAAGAVGMEVGFDESSTQYNVLHDFASTAEAGSEFTVTDSSGNVVLSYTFDKSYQSVVFSSADLAEGTYTVTAGSQSEEITISSIVTSNGSGMGMGGDMQPGGMNGGDFGGGFGGRMN